MENRVYNADSIKILSDLDHIRKNPGMYIGESAGENPRHLLQEAIDNAMDEAMNGYSEGFEVHVEKLASDDMVYTVVDYGSGIPVGYKTIGDKKVSILEAILTKSNSGGKFDSIAYLNSSGVHGVGAKCINALSNKVVIISTNNGVTGKIECVEGEPVAEVKYEKTGAKSGTLISFTINKDNKYFENNQIPFDYIVEKLNVYQAFGIKNIKLFLNNEDVTSTYIISETPFALHQHPMDNGNSAIKMDIAVENKNKEKFRLAFNYISGNSTSYKFYGYVNYLTCNQGGHIMAAQDAIVKAIDMFCEKRNIQKPSTMASDYWIGLCAIVHCNIIKKSFASQTKDKLTTGTGATRDYFNKLVDLLVEEINKQFDKHVGIVKALVQRITDYRKERENRKELKSLNQYITINQSDSNIVRRGSVYKKLVECTSKNRDECSLYITEGDSASGALCRVRDKRYVGILPLRGKILNVSKVTVTKALQSEVIAGIISTIGTGILDKCNVDRIRYKNIYYCADPDDEGKLIINMVIALFVNLLPEVVKQGRLHIVVPPYYIYEDKGKKYGVQHFTDMPKSVVDKGNFSKIKGLGSLTDEEVKQFLLSEDKRYLTVEYPEDLNEFNHILSTIEGKRVLLKDLNLLEE